MHILKTVTILTVTLHKDTSPQLRLYRIKHSKGNVIILNSQEGDNMSEWNVKSPVIIVVTGYGIIKKDILGNTAIYEKVKTDSTTYTFSENNKEFMFLRNTNIQNILEKLHILKVRCLSLRLSDVQYMNDTDVLKYALDFFDKKATAENLFSFTLEADIIAGVIYERLRLPVLCSIFILLLANTFIRNNLENKYNAQKGVLNHLQRNQIQHEKSNNNKKAYAEEFLHASDIRYAVIADRIASIVPDDISLTTLHIASLDKDMNNSICIEGFSKDNNVIGVFLNNITEFDFVQDAHIENVQHNHRDNRHSFKIRLAIKHN